MATRGSYVHNSMVKFLGHPKYVSFYAISSKYSWFQTKWFTRLVELIQLYKPNPLDFFFSIFTIYQNYTLALKCKEHNISISNTMNIVVIFLIWLDYNVPLNFTQSIFYFWDISELFHSEVPSNPLLNLPFNNFIIHTQINKIVNKFNTIFLQPSLNQSKRDLCN